jgi:hypothetical protein
MRFPVLASVGLASSLLLAPTAQATTTFYSSFAAFSAAAPGVVTENFGTATNGQLVAQGSTLNGLTYTFSTGSGLGGVITPIFNNFSGRSLAAVQGANPPTSTDFFFPGEALTVGFAAPVFAAGMHINVFIGTGEFTFLGNGFPNTAWDVVTSVFVGVVSSTPFSTVTLSGSQDLSSGFDISAIYYATAAVPAPMSLALLLAGIAGLAAVRRAST